MVRDTVSSALMQEIIDSLCMMDDILFRVVAKENKALLELMIGIIINKKIKVEHVETQSDEASLISRSAIFDVFARDEGGRLYDIEIQNGEDGAHPKRARFNSSMLDALHTPKGLKDFSNMHTSYTIMLCSKDVLKGKSSIYHVNRFIEETKNRFNDECHIIYVNAEKYDPQDTSELSYLIHDMICPDYKEMYYNVFRDSVREVKNPKGEGFEKMSESLEKALDKVKGIYKDIYIEQGIEQGKANERKESVINLYKMGLPRETIIQGLKCTEKQYDEWVSETTSEYGKKK